ncbi:LacI family DNA-binding transcriptional regulator [Sulfitobacter guttiformis]|uniref:LacI family transcriptional regulator n=1 Tax=Sulfitobacter guttiformis TaxID=74349 RepID=A0A420DNN6_9RHOB|nr:LacI family DNA-binding transcriptional regulator [Sulfitobacter guttiformis]KIN73112.1 Transcriptional regulator, LacI family [Sulfitobacter guttiformis KCTC 32187]RKE95797.1 LacI family transcriptional regulator [Sulfitobacter guttiformis]
MRNTRSIPTLDDVAKKAGVSTATVSRCINTPDRVVQSTRTRVLKAVEALGYTPNFGARVMAAKRTFTIGAIIPTMENAIFARGLQAFQEELRNRGYTLLVSSSSYDPQIEEEQIRALVARGADGLLLIGYDRDPALYRYLERQAVPALVAWAYAPDVALPAIGFDNRAAMALLAEKVLTFGHRRIGVISGVIKGNDRAANRVMGIKDALAARGISPDTMTVIETPYGFENGEIAMTELMQSSTPPTVVMCGNDVLAAGALRGASLLGFGVPDDVSVTGFDDIELARVVTPALTTVHVPHREMGTKAATALIALVEGGQSVGAQELTITLQLRDTLGPPKNI